MISEYHPACTHIFGRYNPFKPGSRSRHRDGLNCLLRVTRYRTSACGGGIGGGTGGNGIGGFLCRGRFGGGGGGGVSWGGTGGGGGTLGGGWANDRLATDSSTIDAARKCDRNVFIGLIIARIESDTIASCPVGPVDVDVSGTTPYYLTETRPRHHLETRNWTAATNQREMNTRTPTFPNSNPTPTRVLVAEDDERSRNGLVRLLQRDGYDVSVASDGQGAIDILLAPNPPQIALLDWEMPRLDGIHVCWAVRSIPSNPYTYIIMVTAKAEAADALAAFAAGVDDFLSKPMDSLQLLARLRCGERVLGLEKRCAERIAELRTALDEVGKLRRLLPLCKYCNKVRDDNNRWHEFNDYIRENPANDFSDVICRDCMEDARKSDLPREGLWHSDIKSR